MVWCLGLIYASPFPFVGGVWSWAFWGGLVLQAVCVYGLVSLCWLIVQHREVTRAEIPRVILGGICVAILVTFYLLYEGQHADLVLWTLMFPTYGFYLDRVLVLGPLLIVLGALLVMPKQRHQAEPPDIPSQEK